MHKIRAKQRQHIVEWIPGVGVVTDGVTDASSTSGPWTWTPPDGVVTAVLDAVGPGGGAGNGVLGLAVALIPNQALTITAGAAGAGGAIGADGVAAGTTTITGLAANGSVVPGKLIFRGGDKGIGATGTAGARVAASASVPMAK